MSSTQPEALSGKAWYKQKEKLKEGQTLPLPECLSHLSFDAHGLIPVICQCAHSHRVLMMAWMNLEALSETLQTGRMCFWSRSRQTLWRKGESSGNHQRLIDLHIDCDGDTILAKVAQTGAACHTLRPDCFFWHVNPKEDVVRLTSCAENHNEPIE